MKFFIIFLCTTLLGQFNPSNPIFAPETGLVRGGLVAGYDLRGGSGQTVPNMVPGGAALQLGSTSGVDTNDPTRGATGVITDGIDDYVTSSLTASGLTGATSQFVVIPADAATSFKLAYQWGAVPSSLDGFVFANGAANMRSQRFAPVDTAFALSSTGVSPFSYAQTYDVAQCKVAQFTNGGNASIASKSSCATVSITSLAIGAGDTLATKSNGTISFVLIYNRAINPREVRQNHNWLKAQMFNCCAVVLP